MLEHTLDTYLLGIVAFKIQMKFKIQFKYFWKIVYLYFTYISCNNMYNEIFCIILFEYFKHKKLAAKPLFKLI